MKQNKIIALGLNPAWQKTLVFDEFMPGEVNRAVSVSCMPSGKGVNFVRAARLWGQDATVFQFAGGETGLKLCDGLDSEGLPHETVEVKAPTRVCSTCLCRKSGSMTELIEPSGPIAPGEALLLMEKLRASLPSAKALALCGTFPPGITPSFYAEAAAEAKRHGIPVLLDAWKDADQTLKAGVDFLKINREELAELSAEADFRKALHLCFGRYPKLAAIAVTAGAQEAHLSERNGYSSRFLVPKMEKIANPIGAGDTCSAVFLSEILAGRALNEAFAAGLGAATASCLNEKCAVFSKQDAVFFSGKVIKSMEKSA